MKKICFVLTTDIAVKAFLLTHLRALSDQYNISVIVNTDTPDFLEKAGINATVIPLRLSRKICIIKDALTLLRLILHFYQNKYDAVHSVTPKAGLLAMLAGFVTRIPLRIHTFTGQVWATKQGRSRAFLRFIDKLISMLSTNLIIDSPSQRDFLIKEGVVTGSKCNTFGIGSIAGVDMSRFKPDPNARHQIRSAQGIDSNTFLYLFLGRLNHDKGVMDLARAFLQANLPNTKLLFVGPDEQDIQQKIRQLAGAQPSNIHFIDYTNTPEHYMAAADVLCLPSHREGFGSVIIEAASCGIPAIASRIYGITDAIVEGRTGLMHQAGNIDEIMQKMRLIHTDQLLYKTLAKNARQRVVDNFDARVMTQAWCDFYQKVIFND